MKYLIGILLAALLACMPVCAAETGTITGLSEKIYEKTDKNSSIVANVITGCNFVILAEESDEEGNIWYLVETDMKIRGYILAQNVSKNGTDTQEGEADSGDEAENNLSDSAQKQLLTLQTVNIRKNPSTNEEIMGKIPRGTQLDCIEIHTNTAGEAWYEIEYEGIHGFIRGSTVTELDLTAQEQDAADAPAEDTNINPDTGIDIAQLMEAVTQYQEENPAAEEPQQSQEEARLQEESSPQGQNVLGDTFQIEEKGKTAGFRIDMVVVLPVLGILLCLAVINRLFKKLMRLYR